jgi:hypothetical protein
MTTFPTPPQPHPVTGWWYQEFSAGQPATKLEGINAALTFLNEKQFTPPPTVFGNVDGQGTVRLFWYGTRLIP